LFVVGAETTEEGNSDFLKENPNLINFEKRAMIASIFLEISQFQVLQYPFK
jgi:hypothetical protein